MGMTRRAGAIHRAIVLPELYQGSPDDTVHHLLMRVITDRPDVHAVADLGCGVGATMRYVLRQSASNMHVTGITISPVQAQVADDVTVAVASFEALPFAHETLDVVWAIESFAHSTQPEQFFTEVARVLASGGLCVVCDDMRVHATQSTMLAAFQRGWIVPNIDSLDVHCRRAAAAGLQLVSQIDLTAGMRIHALPSWLATLCVRLFPIEAQPMFVRSVLGSMALQQCYAAGIMQYQFVVFQKL